MKKININKKELSKLYIDKKLSTYNIAELNCNEENLITLCQQCNSKVNGKRDFWFAYFTEIIEQIYIKI
jgi:hypothetical protein